MSSDVVVKVNSISKNFHIYDRPSDRLKQFLFPRVQRYLKMSPRRYYRDFWALKDISFELKRGETIGIVGRNGSGKSTLLQIICGTLAPSQGEVRAYGRIAALLELGSGFNLEYSGKENVYLNGALLGLNKAEIDARYDDITTFADIGDFINQPLKTYSSGMVVRLAFAVAINVNPEILVIDEALAVGDELFQRKCFSKIEKLKELGTTILFVSHSGAQVVQLCDRALLIDSGSLLVSGEPKRVVSLYQKLLYAPHHAREAIKKSLIDGSSIAAPSSQDNHDASVLSISNGDEPLEETYDESLKAANTVIYESRGAQILKPEIFTLANKRVNGLVRGRTYKFKYQVIFDKEIPNVRFGMSIRSVTGMPLGGAYSSPSISESIPYVTMGQIVDVEFTFSCHLNPATYFLNAGVFGIENANEGEVYIHRKVDVEAFRVLPIEKNIETEAVSMEFSASIRVS